MIIPKDEIDSNYGARRWIFSTLYGETKEAVQEKCRKYMEEWPPQGYDTHIVTNKIYYSEKGYYFARVQRWSSCS